MKCVLFHFNLSEKLVFGTFCRKKFLWGFFFPWMEQHGRMCSSCPPVIHQQVIASLTQGHWDQELEACQKHLGPAGHCWGELEAVLRRCGAKEIPTVPWGQVSPARSSAQCQRLTHGSQPMGRSRDTETVMMVLCELFPGKHSPGEGHTLECLEYFETV